jgi:hypothetical protein
MFSKEKKTMKTAQIPRKKKSQATTASDAAPSRSKRRPNGRAASALAPETEASAKPARLLPERFPSSDRQCICLGLYAPEAQAVCVAGSFNGWEPSALPLQRQADGRWVVEVVLEPGRHEYRFVVDGQWTDDPLSPAYVSNPFGGLNCVLVAGTGA